MTNWIAPFLPALLGGLAIGAASGLSFFLIGRIAGVSGILSAALRFQPGLWRWAFLLGLVIAGAGAFAAQAPVSTALTKTAPLHLAIAGLLVGFGAQLSNGCTSGHGVSGLARFSLRSLVAVLVFMTTAALTVYVTHHVSLAP